MKAFHRSHLQRAAKIKASGLFSKSSFITFTNKYFKACFTGREGLAFFGRLSDWLHYFFHLKPKRIPNLNETEWIAALQLGNEAAFSALVEQYQQMVYNTVLGMVQHAQDAEDTAQEVFIQVHQSIAKFKGEAKLSTWIYRICITKSLDLIKHRRRKKRFGIMQSIFGPSQEMPEIPDFHHPGIRLDQKENAAIVFKALQGLPENQRVAFVLQKLEGLGQAEIGAIMQLKEGAVESLLQRAKQNLKKSLKEV